ncbi:hypothetical protein [Flavobacterium soli]|uniref:hypothetical protein n=1 Tax=Flavobacterium soli TaxID=344881 RepID=UPI0012F96A6C|nr:hypothetical protein [Flavobacterium soli]
MSRDFFFALQFYPEVSGANRSGFFIPKLRDMFLLDALSFVHPEASGPEQKDSCNHQG